MSNESAKESINRRDFIKAILAGVSVAALDWSTLPVSDGAETAPNEYDAVIVGSGLGGLSCAAAFARQGFKALVLEQHSAPGGYATTFKRPGGFVFDVSLHSTTVGERNGVHNLISGFPEITDVEFVPHPCLYRAVYPDYDIRVPQKNVQAYVELLSGHFPEEKEGIAGLFDAMKGIAGDVQKLRATQGQINMGDFPVKFPYLFSAYAKTWGQVVDAHIKSEKLKGLVSALWGYFGLPPSRLASLYYALPVIGYLEEGGYYPVGKSQKISDAFVKFIEERKGKVMLNTRVAEILTKDHAAYGVKTADGREFTGKVVVSNANAHDTFHKLMAKDPFLAEYLSRMATYTVSLSCFQVFLGLNKDLVRELAITDTEIFLSDGYDVEAEFESCLAADVEKCGIGATLYDNLYDGYSPKGKNTLSLITLQGFDYWKKYEADYFAGKKTEYRKEKERLADLMIARAEETLLPGLSGAVEVREIGTPLTNVRYTSNYRGAMYGWDQTLENAIPRRLPHATPIKNLYLAGAWTNPGGGYGAVIPSGLECFGQIMAEWQKG
ncbi:MAG: NAD(P)/FAD-dependent oxidoreductase [Candidatus Eisenbacteria bacterium]